jgi:hypothetical protein
MFARLLARFLRGGINHEVGKMRTSHPNRMEPLRFYG